MPFTLAHPAAVMPLRRLRFLEPLALVIGSTVPDFPYFLPGHIAARFEDTHTLQGSVGEDLLTGLGILVFVLLARRVLVALLSDRARSVFLGVAQRFTAHRINWLLAVPSLVIGCWTHIVWDSFTHRTGWVVRRMPVLSAEVPIFGLYTGEVYHLLQYGSSLLGLIVLIYWYRQLANAGPPTAPAGGVPQPVRVFLLAIVIIAGGTIGTIQGYHSHMRFPTFYGLAYLLLTRTLAWFTIFYFAVGSLVVLIERLLAGREPPEPEPLRSEIQ